MIFKLNDLVRSTYNHPTAPSGTIGVIIEIAQYAGSYNNRRPYVVEDENGVTWRAGEGEIELLVPPADRNKVKVNGPKPNWWEKNI